MLALQASDADAAQSLAVPYLEACGWTLGGWMLARLARAVPDREALAAFYLTRLLPRAAARCLEIRAASGLPPIAEAPAAA
jgi:dienelactone hydrolase